MWHGVGDMLAYAQQQIWVAWALSCAWQPPAAQGACRTAWEVCRSAPPFSPPLPA